ncbi:histidine kinase/response regulator receiver domain-containing protein [Desulfocapsa sulfexigens DSM 10523]|uniref:histidine kinase n=1 Tax=Desulfocapsa sulfexigens (strain DSM 10523 / SB164P1) TaxID=1167006 RepID=M1PT58_DESSD|nr:hybrid sensor histidine kinase/response regulator [Desulfocapsa sulfexigens]AGF79491.1 histidine kinase/response regulator receiver domain-containing protein [Desulfocapsa sulfexigens DSM 10523]
MATKVLIVDDELINVRLIEEILEYEKEFQYRSVGNGKDALALLDEYSPDIIILDIMMPVMNGYEVCREIKKDTRHSLAKVLMVSGKAMIEERLKGYEAGADDYITKPFVDDELLAKLKVFSKLKKTEEIDALKTTILQLFSHETKTPLNGILLGSQLILDTPSISEKVAEYAKLIKISGERIHDLVRKILLLSSLRNNGVLYPESRSVRQYLRDFSQQVNALPDTKCMTRIDCKADFDLEIDWKLFQAALNAVVENAVKYSPNNATVLLTASTDDQLATINVIDSGPGIALECQEKIFDEFYSPQIEHHGQGTALSLAIAKEIMCLHQGSLDVNSVPGEGAEFRFSFPLSTAGE